MPGLASFEIGLSASVPCMVAARHAYRKLPPDGLIDWRVAPADTVRSLQKAHKQELTMLVEYALCFCSVSTPRLSLLGVLHIVSMECCTSDSRALAKVGPLTSR